MMGDIMGDPEHQGIKCPYCKKDIPIPAVLKIVYDCSYCHKEFVLTWTQNSKQKRIFKTEKINNCL